MYGMYEVVPTVERRKERSRNFGLNVRREREKGERKGEKKQRR